MSSGKGLGIRPARECQQRRSPRAIIPAGNPGPGAAASSHRVPRGIAPSPAAAPVLNTPGNPAGAIPATEGLHKNAIAQTGPEWSSVTKFAVAFLGNKPELE